jgi:hypothetical protein
MAPPSDPPPALTEVLSRLRAAWPAARWEWDGRFRCALSTLDKNTVAQGRAALTAALPALFTAKTVAKAPPAVAKICTATGGLRGDQEVFAAELPDGSTAYCLWWPWGTGSNFSARIGALGAADLAPAVKTAFGV